MVHCKQQEYVQPSEVSRHIKMHEYLSLSIQIDSDPLKEPNVPTLENHPAAEVHAAHHISF